MLVTIWLVGCHKADSGPMVFDGDDHLPCDVRAVLAEACTTCHAMPANSASKVALTTRSAFFESSISVDGDDLIARTMARLHDAANPMPPVTEPRLSAGQLATLDAWLADDAPAGECEPIAPAPAPVVCTSGSTWTMGETGAFDMSPGRACKTCHAVDAPAANYAFQGTVFPTYHEADDCNAIPPDGARVEILDMAGNVTKTLTPGLSGNISSFDPAPTVPIPYRARLVANGLVREMASAQEGTDCNACHTEQGKNANTDHPEKPAPPGRLTWPSVRPD